MRSLLLLLWLVPAIAFAAERTHAIVPEDYFSLATITEVAVSPDGKFVAFGEARWSKEDDLRKGDLWVIATDGKSKPVRLTFDRANDRNLKWSADSKTIYFLGNRKREAEKRAPYDGKTQAWCIPVIGGEPRAITKVDGGIDHYDFAVKANVLFYSVEVTHRDDDAFAKLRSQHKLDYGGGIRKVSEIHRMNLDDWRTEKVYDEKRYVREFAVTQDGKRIAMVTAFDDSVIKSEGESRVDIATLGEPGASAPGVWNVITPPTDAYRAKAASPNAWLENLAWNPDGSKIAFNAIFDGHPVETILGLKKDDAWKMSVIDRGTVTQIRGYGSPLKWSKHSLSALVDWNGRVATAALTIGNDSVSSASVSVTYPSYVHYAFDNANTADGIQEVVVVASQSQFADICLYTGNADSPFGTISKINTHTDAWRVPTIKHITWKAPDGSSVGGVLELPPGYDGKSKLPLVVAIHGGPTTSAKAALEFDPHNGRMYFSAAGYAVLCPNYRGSTGYGDKFVTDLIGHENDIEVKDIIAGVEHLIKEGIADPECVGVMGWSNGGYLTNCLITRKDLPFKLKAASSGAGIVDTVAEWGFNDEPAYPHVFKKGHPWETPEIYKATSPTYALGNVTTPTLIHVGGNDVRCPPGHSRMLYRALKEYVKVPTELCEYPGEPHGLTKMSHRKAKMEWDLAWFEKYLK